MSALATGIAVLGAAVFAGAECLASQLDQSHRSLPVAMGIASFCILAYCIVRFESFLRRSRFAAGLFACLCLFVLASTTVAYFDHLASVDPLERVYAREGEHLAELARIDPKQRYFIDGGSDEWAFVLFRQGFSAIEYQQIPIEEKGPVYLYAGIFRLVGDFNTYLLVILHCAARVLASWLFFRITRGFLDERAAAGAAGLLLAMPEAVLWAAMLHKDNLIVALMVISLSAVLNGFVRRSFSWPWCIAFLLSLLGLAFSRSGLFLPVVAGGMLAIALSSGRRLRSLTTYVASVAAGIGIFTAMMPSPVVAHVKANAVDRVYYKLVRGSDFRRDVQNTSYRGLPEDSLVQRLGGGELTWTKLHYVPVRIAMYLVAPFPAWSMSNLQDRYTVPTSVIFMTLSFFFLRGIWEGARPGQVAFLTMLSFLAATAFAVAFAGGFVYERYRLLLAPMYVALSSLGEARSTYRQKWLLIFAALLACVLGLGLYRVLK